MSGRVDQAALAQVLAGRAQALHATCQVLDCRVRRSLACSLQLLQLAVHTPQPHCPLAHDVDVQLGKPSLMCGCCEGQGQGVGVALTSADLVERCNRAAMPRVCQEVAACDLLLLPPPRLVRGS